MSYRGVVHSIRRRKRRNMGSGHQLLHGRTLHVWQRATLAELFESLKNVVCPSTQKTPAKWKILDHAKGFLLEKEVYLSKLLQLKAIFLQNDEGPKRLEEVQEEYRRLYARCFVRNGRCSPSAHVPDVDKGPGSSEEYFADEGMDAPLLSQSSGLSGIQEFEGYLHFYKQTLDHLLCSGVLSPDQPVLPVVSEAISSLWNSFSPEQRAEVQQYTLTESSITWVGPAEITPCSSLDSSQLTSLNTSGTSASEEDLLQDAYDVVQRDMDATRVNSSTLLPPRSGDCEKLRETYRDITSFIRSHMSEEQQPTQDMCPTDDHEELFLRCSESFDEDF